VGPATGAKAPARRQDHVGRGAGRLDHTRSATTGICFRGMAALKTARCHMCVSCASLFLSLALSLSLTHSLPLSQIECGWLCSGGGANAIDTCAAASCGDGTLGGSEECDDGNTMALDGCDSTCQIEPGYACMHYEPPYYPCGAYSSWCTPVSVSVSVSVAPWRCRYLLYWDSLRSLCPDCCAEGRLPLSSARALTRDIYHAALAGVSTAV
jgi:cysteine-rich repeat protein